MRTRQGKVSLIAPRVRKNLTFAYFSAYSLNTRKHMRLFKSGWWWVTQTTRSCYKIRNQFQIVIWDKWKRREPGENWVQLRLSKMWLDFLILILYL